MSDQSFQAQTPQQSRVVLLGTLLVGVVATFVVLYAFTSRASRTQSPIDSNSATANAQFFTGITNYTPVRPLTDFTLMGTKGQPVSLSDFRGKLTVLYFGYINCPDICQATMLNFKQIRQGLGDKADQVNLVFISVDPDRDTPSKIGEYIPKFDPAIIGLAGDLAVFEQIKNDYNLEFIEVPIGDSTPTSDVLISHTSDLFLADTDGNLTTIYTSGIDAQSVIIDLQGRLGSS